LSAPATIVAISSARGRALRSLIRLSGTKAFETAATLGVTPPDGPVRIVLPPLGIVPGLASFFPEGHSFTGEATVELLVVGNPFIADSIVDAAAACNGVRQAQPGEFSARAFLNGRLTLEAAEGVAALIGATQTSHLAAAARLLSGEVGRDFCAWAEAVASLLALTEAGIDFTDAEDVVAITPTRFLERAGTLAAAMRSALATPASTLASAVLPRVVLLGAPNAGKSTLFNALLGRDRVITSPIAGTTRDVIEEELSLADVAPLAGSVLLADLPGLDEQPTGEVGRSAQHAALDALRRADAVLWCHPSGHFKTEELANRGMPELAARLIRVRTFADQPAPATLPTAIADAVSVCGLDGFGLATLKRAIADAVAISPADAASIIVPRHRRAAALALHGLDAALALAASEPDQSRWNHPELAANELRSALDACEELTGRISPDDILGRVFSTFCIGK